MTLNTHNRLMVAEGQSVRFQAEIARLQAEIADQATELAGAQRLAAVYDTAMIEAKRQRDNAYGELHRLRQIMDKMAAWIEDLEDAMLIAAPHIDITRPDWASVVEQDGSW